MEPVVNGLTDEYEAQVEFRRIDANTADGKKLFRSFNLRGHPSYVILNPGGELIWAGLGEQPSENLAEQIRLGLGE